MTPEDRERVEALVLAALRRDPEEREGFLEPACADRPDLLAAAKSQLRAHETDLHASATGLTREPLGSSASSSPNEGQRRVGPYIIRKVLGRGGMGVVYLADDTRLKRLVALKSLPHDIGRDSAARERLRREARAAASLAHPGIATVYALEEIGNDLYLACEYVPGPTLRELLDKGPLPPKQIVGVALQLARALVAAHGHGIVHRDLKPENIVRTPTGDIKVLDFGIARVEGLTTTRLTHTGTIIGTPAYMAPELVDGAEADFRSDLFALGVMVYEMATGRNPFEATTVTDTLVRVVKVDPPALSEVCGAEFEPLDAVVSVCLRKDREDRYRSTQQLVEKLEDLRGEISGARDRPARRRESELRPPTQGLQPAARIWWWRTHQLVAIALYVAAAARAWQIKTWLAQPVPLWIFVALGAGAMIGGTMRAHLLFTEAVNLEGLRDERRRTRRLIVIADPLIAAALAVDGLLVAQSQALSGVLTIALALGVPLATFVIEPATTDAAFSGDRKTGAKRKTGARRSTPTRRTTTGADGPRAT